jgi:hypothetical protein
MGWELSLILLILVFPGEKPEVWAGVSLSHIPEKRSLERKVT